MLDICDVVFAKTHQTNSAKRKKRKRHKKQKDRPKHTAARLERLLAIAKEELEVRDYASTFGLHLMSRPLRTGKHQTAWHWMFNDTDGKRLLDYWPTNRKWWSAKTNQRGTATDHCEAVRIAFNFLSE